MNFYSISVKQARIPPNTDDQSDWIIITVFWGGGLLIPIVTLLAQFFLH